MNIYQYFRVGIAIALFSLISTFYLHAQPENITSDYYRPSPDVSSLGKALDNPVAKFTGTVSTNVPIHTMTDGPLSASVDISYISSGVRVAEVASNVGLGWSLNVGGSLTRVVRGKPDEQAEGYYHFGHTIDASSAISKEDVASGTKDGEADIFNFSAGNYSGKFVFDASVDSEGFNDSQIRLLNQQDVKIKYEYYSHEFRSFTITTPDGNIYHFGNLPESTTNEGIEKSEVNSSGVGSFADVSYTSQWHLLRIESSDKVHQINYEYEDEEYGYYDLGSCKKIVTFCENEQGGGNSGSTKITCNGLYINALNKKVIRSSSVGKRITSISNGIEKLEFVYDSGNREDLNAPVVSQQLNCKALDKVKLTYPGNTGYCKEWRLTQSYFRDLDEPLRPEYKRLKLDEIQEFSCDGTKEKPKYEFYYHADLNSDGSQFLINRLSKATDHWGFYNGASSNESNNSEEVNIPETISCFGMIFGDNNRSVNELHSQEGVLEKIIHPTMGMTLLEYENHDYYDEHQVLDNTTTLMDLENCDIEDNNSGVDCCGLQPNEEDQETFVSQNQIDNTMYEWIVRNEDNITCPKNVTSTLEIWHPNGTLVKSENKSVRDGEETFKGSLNDIANLSPNINYTFRLIVSNGDARFILNENTYITVNNRPTGGLRIKKIEKYESENGALLESKEYEYGQTDENNKSSGIIIQQPKYEKCAIFSPNDIHLAVYSDQSFIPLTEYNGRHIIYSRVAEKSPSSGEIVTKFYTEEPRITIQQSIPSVPPKTTVQSGEKELDDYKNDLRQTVSKTNYTSSPSYRDVVGDMIKAERYQVNTCNSDPTGQSIILPADLISSYTLDRGYNILSEVVEEVDQVIKTTDYTYDHANHFQVKTHEVSGTGIDPVKTTYHYFDNYPDATISNELDNRNMKLSSWKTEVEVNGEIIDGNYFDYSFFSASGNPTSSVTDKLYYRDQYRFERSWDENGNILAGSWDNEVDFKEYDINSGRPSKIQADGWQDMLFSYNSDGLVTGWEYLNHEKEMIYYPGTNLVQKEIDIDDQEINYEYDALLRLEWIKERNNNRSKQFVYAYNPNKVETRSNYFDQVDQNIIQEYDGIGRLISTKNVESNAEILRTYDLAGRLKTQTDGEGKLTTYNYYADPLNRIHQTIDPMGFITTMEYDGVGNEYKNTVTDPDGLISIEYSDILGRKTKMESGQGSNFALTQYEYDDKNRLTKIIPPDATASNAGLIYRYVYDGADNIITKKLPDREEMEYQYDDRNLEIGMRDQNIIDEGKSWLCTRYDDYGRPDRIGFGTLPGSPTEILEYLYYDGIGTGNQSDPIYMGRMDKSRIQLLDGFSRSTSKLTSTYVFDQYGRVTDLDVTGPTEYREEFDYSYFMDDQIDTETHISQGNTTIKKMRYDNALRLEKEEFSLNGVNQVIQDDINYNKRDQVEDKDINGVSYAIDYTYNNNGWLKRINSTRLDLRLYYNDPLTGGTVRKNGSISSMKWNTPAENMGYLFTYDHLNRITDAVSINNGGYDAHYSYHDQRGNLQSIDRYKATSSGTGQIDDLALTLFSGTNRLKKVTNSITIDCPEEFHVSDKVVQEGIFGVKNKITSDASAREYDLTLTSESEVAIQSDFEFEPIGLGQMEVSTGPCPDPKVNLAISLNEDGHLGLVVKKTSQYQYDGNGNITYDPVKDLNIKYNHHNLPYEVTDGEGNTIKWEYAADGRKLKKLVNDAKERVYLSDMEFVDDNLKTVYHSVGHIDIIDGQPNWRYKLEDHLGNTRVLMDDNNVVLEEHHYYPFGLEMRGDWNNNNSTIDNDYLYNNKEWNNDLGLGLYAYGFRMYDPAIGRFTGVDPISDQFPWVSTYNYAENEPIANIDLHGLQRIPYWVKDRIAGMFNSAMGTNIPTEGKVSAPPRREVTTQEIGNKMEGIGDGISATGLSLTPIAPEIGVPLTTIGEALSLTGAAIEIGSNIRDEGLTKENAVDIGVEATFELLPKPFEAGLDKLGLDKLTKQAVESRVNLVNMAAEKAAEHTIEQSRSSSDGGEEKENQETPSTDDN